MVIITQLFISMHFNKIPIVVFHYICYEYISFRFDIGLKYITESTLYERFVIVNERESKWKLSLT